MGGKIVGSAFAASLFIMVERQRKYFESVICVCHIYKQIWKPLVGEILTLEQEEDNNHDKFAVSLFKNATVLGHGPREFLQVFRHFPRHGETITCEVTDQRKRGKATSHR